MGVEVVQHPGADDVLEALQELGRKSGGFVEAEAAGLAYGILVRIDPFEEAVHQAELVVEVRIARLRERRRACQRPLRSSRILRLRHTPERTARPSPRRSGIRTNPAAATS